MAEREARDALRAGGARVLEERVLVLAPTGLDAALSEQILAEAGLATRACPDLGSLVDAIDEGAGAVVVTEEALHAGSAQALVDALRVQPAWSDLPVLVLTYGGASSPTAVRALDLLGNVVLLERPVRVPTLLSALRMALRARRRQYQVRAQVQELRHARDELELRVRERTAELERINDELEAFSYSVSHDLRAPLRKIDGFSTLLVEEHADELGPGGLGHLRRVRDGVTRMRQLIDDLLGLSRVTRAPLRRGRVDVSELARAVLAELAAGSSRRVRASVQEGLVAYADGGLLRIAFENLLSNAWKFTAGRAAARIEVGRRDDGTFFVRDDGAGFDPAYAERLFAPFRRLHSTAEFEGTGIGLATVQRIVNRHGGTIWAESAVDEGATFYFTLPARGGPAGD